MKVFMRNCIVSLYQSKNWEDIFTNFIFLVIFTIQPSRVMLFGGMIKMQDLKLVFKSVRSIENTLFLIPQFA